MSGRGEVIRSRANPLVKRLLALKARADAGLALLEGEKLVREALSAGVPVLEAAATPRAWQGGTARATLDALGSRGVPVRTVDERVLAALSDAEAPQGVFAVARRPAFPEEAVFAGVPLVLVAVGVQDPGNLGGLLRTAEAAGATGAYLAAGTADPFSWKALRGAMGSAFRLPHVRGLAATEILERLRARGVRAAAAVVRDGTAYTEARLDGPLALVLGNESAGLPDDVASAADLRLTIPLQGRAESLNVGVAAGILLFEAARRRRSLH